MPKDTDNNRISEKMKDFVRNMIVPDPMKRPTCSQIINIIDNWENKTIRLSVKSLILLRINI